MARVAFATIVACAISTVGCGSSAPVPVTFNRDVAPIVFANCASCHRPGGDGPFSLLTYHEAARHATDIAEQTGMRHMPPWLPEPGDVPIAGVRRLTDAQIDTIRRWVRDGALEGAAADLPAAPVFRSDWQLGTPDAVLRMPRPFVLKPGPEDVYRNVVLHGDVPADAFIRAVELRTNGSPIHHALVRLSRTPVAHARDGRDGQPGFDGMSSEILQDPEGQFLGWAPGRGPMVSPEGMPWPFGGGTAVVLELHLIPSTHPVDIQPSIALYFSSAPPVHRPVSAMMISKRIDIPPGEANYVVTDRHQLPVATELIGVFPHAHYLGKEILVTASPPGERQTTLLDIRHWSFHWQQDYRYLTPVRLPRGTVIETRFTYDNSASNPANPSDPPVRVRLGPRSVDEMANLGLQFLTSSPADATTLLASFAEKVVRDNIAYGETRVAEVPDSVPDRVLLGSSYAKAGRFHDAIPHLEAALRLDPRHAIAESYLGGAHMALGRLPLAVRHFERSARLAPGDERAQLNLADAYEKAGRQADAAAAYRRAIAMNDESLEAHVKLGALFSSAGRLKEALPHLRRVAALRPDLADAHSILAGVLAALGIREEAERHLRRALEIDPNHGDARHNLAVLLRGGRD